VLTQHETIAVTIDRSDLQPVIGDGLVVPNPFVDRTSIVVPADADGTVDVRITNTLGEKVMHTSLPVAMSDPAMIVVEGTTLPPGHYLVTVYYADRVLRYVIVKSR
jgi:hypothetical protein